MHFFFVSPFLFSFFERRASRGFPLRPKKAPTFLFSAGVSSLLSLLHFFVGRMKNLGVCVLLWNPLKSVEKSPPPKKKESAVKLILPLSYQYIGRERSERGLLLSSRPSVKR